MFYLDKFPPHLNTSIQVDLLLIALKSSDFIKAMDKICNHIRNKKFLNTLRMTALEI